MRWLIQTNDTRMVFLGKPSPEFEQAYAAVLDANRRAMAAVRPGVPASEIDHIARRTLDAAGYGQYFTHRTGHGIGLEGHEPPWIMDGNDIPLKEKVLLPKWAREKTSREQAGFSLFAHQQRVTDDSSWPTACCPIGYGDPRRRRS